MDGSVCLFGRGPQMHTMREDVELAASSDANVLITGERGVGKRLIGDLIHRRSQRNHSPVVLIRCSQPECTVQMDLITAFDRRAGTIVLDDVDELTPAMQRLLMQLVDVQFAGTSCTESKPRRHVRVIAAAAPRLYELVHAAAFHEDVFYRLNIVHVSIPPLRERRGDIPGLVLRLLRSPALEGCVVTPDAMVRLVAHGWPGNVRELEGVLEDVARHRAVIRSQDLPQHVPSAYMDANAGFHAARPYVPREIARVH